MRSAVKHDKAEEAEEEEDEEADSGVEDFMEGMKKAFTESQHKYYNRNADQKESVVNWELQRLALELNMSVDDVQLVKTIFDTFDTDGSGTLDVEEWEQLVVRLLEHNFEDKEAAQRRAKAFTGWHWWDEVNEEGDDGAIASIGFRDFIKWYSSNGFKQDMLLSDQERWLRSIAKEYGLSANHVDSIKRTFDSFDADKSGAVDIDEFRMVLRKVLRVPQHVEFSWSRVKYFWSEIDVDKSGHVVFEEFLEWYVKHTSCDQQGKLPFDDFYKGIRFARRNPDPPAHTLIPRDEGSKESTGSAAERFEHFRQRVESSKTFLRRTFGRQCS